MKKLIPVLIAIVLIAIIGGIWVVPQLYEKFSYSDEEKDLNEYFHIQDDRHGALIIGEERVEEQFLVKDGAPYFSYDTVSDYFIYTRLYVNEEENMITYVLPSSKIKTEIGSSYYTTVDLNGNGTDTDMGKAISFYEGDTLYVSPDFLRLFVVFDYMLFEEPYRMQVYTAYDTVEVAQLTEDTQIRYQGGVKSPILRQMQEGETVHVLETMENWTKVKTEDCFVGYVENKRLSNPLPDTPSFSDTTVLATDEDYTSLSMPGKVNMVWHQVAGVAGNDSIYDLLERTQDVNVVSPTWFYLTGNSGDIVSFASGDYVEAMHQQGRQVWAMCDDFTEQVDDFAIFSSTENRNRLIGNLISQVETYGIDGINIDFERVGESAGKHFVEFIRELSMQCRARGIYLSVDNYPPEGGAIWYNRREQGVYCDYVIVMGYDEHWGSGGVAGSVASISYVQRGIEDTLQYVPAKKLINGIPFYTRIWMLQGTEVDSDAVDMEVAQSFLGRHSLTPTWQEEFCQNYAECEEDGIQYKVWLEDAQSIQAKLSVMSSHQIAGVSAWKLGMETRDVWDMIHTYMQAD